MNRSNKAQRQKEPLSKYPGAILAMVSLLTIIFSAGLAWASQTARLTRLEEITATKQELSELKSLLQLSWQKADDRFTKIEDALSRIEKNSSQS